MSDDAFAWAAIAPDWASPPNFIHEGTVRRSRKEVQELIGGTLTDDPRKGWKIAYRRGWRCKRVVIRIAFGKDS